MATVTRLDTNFDLNTASAWDGTGGGAGGQPGSSDTARWNGITTYVSKNLGGSVSWGGLELTSSQTTTIVFGGGVAATLTLGASGIDLSASGANLLSQSGITVALGATQAWTIGAGRTYTVQGVISGASPLTISGSGTVALVAAARTAWSGGTTVASGARLTIATTGQVGSAGTATNAIVVQSGGAFYVAGTAQLTNSNFTVSGAGNANQYGAIYLDWNPSNPSYTNPRSVTVAAADTVITVNPAYRAINVAGNITGDVIYNMYGGSSAAGPFGSYPSTIEVSGWIRLKSVNPFTLVETANGINIGGSPGDLNSFGNATNRVWVESSSGLNINGFSSSNSSFLARDYTFEGESTPGALGAGKAYAIYFNAATNATADCTAGFLRAAVSGRYIKIGAAGAAAGQNVSFNGMTLVGDFGLVTFQSTIQLRFLTASDISGWNGPIQSTYVVYQKAPVGAATWNDGATINNTLGSALTLAHSSYTVRSFTFTGSSSMSLGPNNVTALANPTWTVSANTLTVPGNIAVASGTFGKAGAGTLVLAGAMSDNSAFSWSAGNLTLNNNDAAGPSAATFTATSTGTLDSTTGAVLTQNGAVAPNANFTWKGTANLTFGTGNVTIGSDRNIIFAGTGETGTLKFSGAITSSLATLTWNIGGSTPSAKQRVTLVGANASLTAGTAAEQHQVTAGYFRIENNNGLGAAGTTTTWWVGATNLGSVTTKAALELAGVTTPDVKSVNLYGQGPNDDGALIGVSGTSIFRGGISIPNVAGTRIGVKGGATLTLAYGFYTSINAANAGTPLTFVAESGSTLNVDRVLGGPVLSGSNIGAVNIVNGTGTVVLSRANLHTGAMTCSAGTTKLTHANAVGAGAGNNVTVTADATIEVNGVKEVFPATLTLGSSGTPAIFKISA